MITAVFDSQRDAQEAQARLLSMGLREQDVRLVDSSGGAGRPAEDKGVWETIKDLFVSDDDRPAYTEGLRRGCCLLTARVEDVDTDEAIRVLEASNAIDLEERAEQWRSEGWSGREDSVAALGASGISSDRNTAHLERDVVQTDTLETRADAELDATEEAIPIVREQLRVGKREVDRGGVRVRSYIVEEPINERVELREERVEVERRPVGRSVGRDAGDLLQERTIEMTESAEEAVISKEAEITEEVVVRKFEGRRTEGVSDTVRHTEVDVEDTRTDPQVPPAGKGKGSRGKSDSKPAR
jgi:uncharacterized protein (TIGR02271 family)